MNFRNLFKPRTDSAEISVDVVKATDAAIEEGVWLRPFRDLIYTMPPYVTSPEDVARICRAIDRAVDVA